MKKRALALVLVLLLITALAPAQAAGRLRVEQENFHVFESYSIYAYAYAKVANVGDKPIKVNTGLLEIFDAQGDPITSVDYFNGFAQYLAPGEYTYVRLNDRIEDVPATDVDDYMLTVTGKADTSKKNLRLEAKTSYVQDVPGIFNTLREYMYVEFTNTTDEPLYDISVVLALLDDAGNILYLDDASLYSDKALMPGSSMQIRKEVNSTYLEHYEKNNLVPTTVDAIVYVELDAEE